MCPLLKRPDRILTAVTGSFLRVSRGLLAALVLLAAVLITGTAPRSAATPRVLVVQFENDVNPVTQDYLTDEIHRANDGSTTTRS